MKGDKFNLLSSAEMSAGWEDRARVKNGEEKLVDNPHVQRMCENSYRRGFFQGAVACREAILRDEVVIGEIDEWIARLMAWRNKLHKGRFEEPEWLSRNE